MILAHLTNRHSPPYGKALQDHQRELRCSWSAQNVKGFLCSAASASRRGRKSTHSIMHWMTIQTPALQGVHELHKATSDREDYDRLIQNWISTWFERDLQTQATALIRKSIPVVLIVPSPELPTTTAHRIMPTRFTTREILAPINPG